VAKLADLLSVDEALHRILASCERLDAEDVPLSEVLGRVLAEAVKAEIDLPPFANSSMDGFALWSASTQEASRSHPAVLTVDGLIAAGARSGAPLSARSCARIMTGAPLPPGADAVIPFEEVEDRGRSISVAAPVARGACVRPAGNDVTAGSRVLEEGSELHAPQVALLAALGIAHVPVVRRPIVAILSTGDELVKPGTPLSPGQIYNSNTPMLTASVVEAGGLPLAGETARDDPEGIVRAIGGVGKADLLVTSGGASVGDFDHVKGVVGSSGNVDFWRVRVRPGKPLLFGSIGDTPVIGLPGNPTSAMVTFEEFVRPAIRAMLGASPQRPQIEAVLDESVDNRGGRQTYFRVRLSRENGRFHASLSGAQDSGMLYPLAHADGLLLAPEDREVLGAGEIATVQVWRLPIEE